MPLARIDLARGKPPEYRAAVGDVVYEGIVGILKAPEGDRFMVIGEADELNRRLGVRREDVFVSLVFVDREDWSFSNGEPW